MRNLIVAAAFAPACLLLTATAPAQAPTQDILDKVTEKATELFGEKGYSPTGWSNNGTLSQGAEKRVSVTLKGASVYTIVGMCDGDCSDLNLNLLDSSGNEVDNDLEDDDFPIVATSAAGSYTLNVSMKACKSSNCRFRLVAYKK